MFLWNLRNPLEYTPMGYFLAIIWNISELLNIKLPMAGWCFGKIINKKGDKIV